VEAAKAELAYRNLLDFCRAVYPNFQSARHHIAIIDALEAVERGDIRRLLLELPPRHGKSTLASHLFPSWYLGRNPDRRVIACSYSVDLSFDLSRKARNLLSSPEYAAIFPNVRLAPDPRSVGQWNLCEPHLGGYVSAGVGGGITGRGAHLLLIDDPLKNAEEAASSTILDAHWNWYTSTAYTRLEGEGAVILITTRWSEADLAGRLLRAQAEGGDQWHVVHLPALAEENDQLGRAVDEALWPEKYDEGALARIRAVIGPRDFAALYQQRPSPPAGTIFLREWWKRFATFDRSQAQQIIQVWDTAFQAKQTNDYSVCSTWAQTSSGVYILDVFRERVEFPELVRVAKDLYARWNPVAVAIENRASGQSLIQTLRRETDIPVIAAPADTDKVSRATAVTPYVESGRVFLPESAPWVAEWIEEHASFPMGAHDDQVDTSSIALKRLFGDLRAFRPEDIARAASDELERADWLLDGEAS